MEAGQKIPEQTKECPLCVEEIKQEAKVCHHCGAEFDVKSKGYCTSCQEVVKVNEQGGCSKCNGDNIVDRHYESKLIEKPKAAPAAKSQEEKKETFVLRIALGSRIRWGYKGFATLGIGSKAITFTARRVEPQVMSRLNRLTWIVVAAALVILFVVIPFVSPYFPVYIGGILFVLFLVLLVVPFIARPIIRSRNITEYSTELPITPAFNVNTRYNWWHWLWIGPTLSPIGLVIWLATIGKRSLKISAPRDEGGRLECAFRTASPSEAGLIQERLIQEMR